MRKVTLGRSGLEVSAVGFGGIPIMRVPDDEAVAAIHRALDLGVTFLDTAAGYADSQRKIGKAIAGRRDGLVLASKSGQRTAEGILADIDRARSEMGVDCIDLYQLHGVSRREQWEQMRGGGGALEGVLTARERGWVAHVGVTSHSLDLAMELADEAAFETLQFPFNLVTSEPAEALIPKCRRLDVGFIVMKPLCGGQYDDAELAFKYLNGYPDVVAIPGIERPGEIEQIAALVESGAVLEGDDKARAEAIATRLGKVFCRRCGYCMPCPQGVPVQTAMVFEGMVRRLSREKVLAGPGKAVLEKVPECVDCGACEAKCPYELPIREQVKKSLAVARELAAGGA